MSIPPRRDALGVPSGTRPLGRHGKALAHGLFALAVACACTTRGQDGEDGQPGRSAVPERPPGMTPAAAERAARSLIPLEEDPAWEALLDGLASPSSSVAPEHLAEALRRAGLEVRWESHRAILPAERNSSLELLSPSAWRLDSAGAPRSPLQALRWSPSADITGVLAAAPLPDSRPPLGRRGLPAIALIEHPGRSLSARLSGLKTAGFAAALVLRPGPSPAIAEPGLNATQAFGDPTSPLARSAQRIKPSLWRQARALPALPTLLLDAERSAIVREAMLSATPETPPVLARLSTSATFESIERRSLIARIRGTLWPERRVVMGVHADDESSRPGLIATLRIARRCAHRARSGRLPSSPLEWHFYPGQREDLIAPTESLTTRDAPGETTTLYLDADRLAGGTLAAAATPAGSELLRQLGAPRWRTRKLDALAPGPAAWWPWTFSRGVPAIVLAPSEATAPSLTADRELEAIVELLLDTCDLALPPIPLERLAATARRSTADWFSAHPQEAALDERFDEVATRLAESSRAFADRVALSISLNPDPARFRGLAVVRDRWCRPLFPASFDPERPDLRHLLLGPRPGEAGGYEQLPWLQESLRSGDLAAQRVAVAQLINWLELAAKRLDSLWIDPAAAVGAQPN